MISHESYMLLDCANKSESCESKFWGFLFDEATEAHLINLQFKYMSITNIIRAEPQIEFTFLLI